MPPPRSLLHGERRSTTTFRRPARSRLEAIPLPGGPRPRPALTAGVLPRGGVGSGLGARRNKAATRLRVPARALRASPGASLRLSRPSASSSVRKPGASPLTSRAPALMDVGAVGSVLIAAVLASEHVDLLVVVGSRKASRSDNPLAVPVPIAGCRLTLLWHRGLGPQARRGASQMPGVGVEPTRPARGHLLLRQARLTRSATPA